MFILTFLNQLKEFVTSLITCFFKYNLSFNLNGISLCSNRTFSDELTTLKYVLITGILLWLIYGKILYGQNRFPKSNGKFSNKYPQWNSFTTSRTWTRVAASKQEQLPCVVKVCSAISIMLCLQHDLIAGVDIRAFTLLTADFYTINAKRKEQQRRWY